MTDHIWMIYVLVRGRWRAMRNSNVFGSKAAAEASIVSEEQNRNFYRPQRIDVPVFLKEPK